MKPSQQLPPEIQHYFEQQKRKKQNTRTTIIIVVVVFSIFMFFSLVLAIFVSDIVHTAAKQKETTPSIQTQKPATTDNKTTDSVAEINSPNQIQENNEREPSKEELDLKARDAVAILDVYVKHNMNDPDSFEEVSYDYSYHGTYFIIVLKYQGKNAFGAKVLNFIKAKTDLEGEVLEVIGTD